MASITCNKGHGLSRTTYKGGNYKNSWYCDLCKKSFSKNTARYWCRSCEYDVCTRCRNKKIKQLQSSSSSSSRKSTSSQSSQSQSVVSEQKINALFDEYKNRPSDVDSDDSDDDQVDETLVENHLGELMSAVGYEDDDFAELVLSWQCDAKEAGELTKEEFTTGLKKLGADTKDALKQALRSLHEQLKSKPNTYKELYKYVFDYAKDSDSRVLDTQTAIAMWDVILHRFHFLDQFVTWLEKVKRPSSINRDLWNQLWEFHTIVGKKLESYDPMEAWPVLIDEFVDYLKSSDSSNDDQTRSKQTIQNPSQPAMSDDNDDDSSSSDLF